MEKKGIIITFGNIYLKAFNSAKLKSIVILIGDQLYLSFKYSIIVIIVIIVSIFSFVIIEMLQIIVLYSL